MNHSTWKNPTSFVALALALLCACAVDTTDETSQTAQAPLEPATVAAPAVKSGSPPLPTDETPQQCLDDARACYGACTTGNLCAFACSLRYQQCTVWATCSQTIHSCEASCSTSRCRALCWLGYDSCMGYL